jgi:hypothetical protein
MKRTTQSDYGFRRIAFALATFCLSAAVCAGAAELHAPAVVEAGHGFSISVDGTGQATFYLIGPDHVVKRSVNLGGNLEISSSDVRTAGRYNAIVCGRSCDFISFTVTAAQPAEISFFVHPSRVPVSLRDSIEAAAFIFDKYSNLVMTPTTVDFRVSAPGEAGSVRQAITKNGVTFMPISSTQHEGKVQVSARLNNLPASPQEEVRVIQQVASDACRLRMNAVENGDTVTLETEPVRDCSGNLLPDGTIVSFTKVDADGRSTVDTPIKKGVARTQLSVRGRAQIDVACGVVLGNELALNGKL